MTWFWPFDSFDPVPVVLLQLKMRERKNQTVTVIFDPASITAEFEVWIHRNYGKTVGVNRSAVQTHVHSSVLKGHTTQSETAGQKRGSTHTCISTQTNVSKIHLRKHTKSNWKAYGCHSLCSCPLLKMGSLPRICLTVSDLDNPTSAWGADKHTFTI